MDYRAEARRILEVIKTHDAETALSLAIKHWVETSYNSGRMSNQAVMVQMPQTAVQPQLVVPQGISPEAAEAMAHNPNLPWKLPGAGSNDPHATVDEKVKAAMAASGMSAVQDNGRLPPVGSQGEQRGLETSAVGGGLGGNPLVPTVGGNGSNPMGPGFDGNAAVPSVALGDVNAQASAGQPGLPPGLPVTKQGSY